MKAHLVLPQIISVFVKQLKRVAGHRKENYLASEFHPFEDTEVFYCPGKNEATKQLPAHTAHVVKTFTDLQESVAKHSTWNPNPLCLSLNSSSPVKVQSAIVDAIAFLCVCVFCDIFLAENTVQHSFHCI